MQRLAVACSIVLCAAACGSAPSPDDRQKLVFERWSLPQPTARDTLLGASGNVVVMAHRVSRDGGATWAALAPGIGDLTRVAIHGSVVTVFTPALGLGRWDLAGDAVARVSNTPSYVGDRNWRVDPSTGRAIVFAQVDNAIAVEGAAGWTLGTLPQPSPTDVKPYVKDVESNGSTLLATSAWGIHRSRDHGTTWELVTSSVPNGGRDLLVLADRTFVLVGGTQSYRFDTGGAATGGVTSLVIEFDHEAVVCEDGAILARNKVTYDLGATWRSLVGGGDLQMIVERVGCGGGRYWILARSDAWGYRLVRLDAPVTTVAHGIVAGNWDAVGDQAWSTGGPSIVRTVDGTLLVAGLAWTDATAEWTLREIPARTWASGPALFGHARPRFYTSADDGRTWKAATGGGLDASEPEAFTRAADGALHVSQFTGASDGVLDRWSSTVWRSSDLGATWSIAYQATATRPIGGDEVTGEVHRFVGITDAGAWIATDAVSIDGGASWQPTEVIGNRELAHLTHRGSLVVASPADDLWRVYGDGGLGELRATFAIEADGAAIPASQLRSVAFDELGHAYVARGAPSVQVWRSSRALD